MLTTRSLSTQSFSLWETLATLIDMSLSSLTPTVKHWRCQLSGSCWRTISVRETLSMLIDMSLPTLTPFVKHRWSWCECMLTTSDMKYNSQPDALYMMMTIYTNTMSYQTKVHHFHIIYMYCWVFYFFSESCDFF